MKKGPKWKHDHKLDFHNLRDNLDAVKTRIQALIKVERAKIDHLVGVRDSVKR